MIDDIIDRYIKMRDAKTQLKADFDAKAATLDEAMQKCENFILKTLNESGMESLGTSFGTAFKSKLTSATAADKDMFLGYLRETGNWHLADIRPAKTAVAEFRAANDDLPPGINWREETVVRIRRS